MYFHSLNELPFENFVKLTNFTHKIEFWAVCAKYLLENKEETDKQRNISSLKAFFSKKLLKNSELWLTNYLDDFFEFKLSKSMMDYNQNKPLQSPAFLKFDKHDIVFKRIECLSVFFCVNFYLIPISIDFREVRNFYELTKLIIDSDEMDFNVRC